MKKTILPLLLTFTFVMPTLSFALESYSLASTTHASTSDTVVATSTEAEVTIKPFTVCSQEAIEVRDSAIADSRTIYNTAMANVLTERKNKEKSAVALKDENKKKNAIKLSAESYKHQAKIAQTTLTQARKIAWENFDKDVELCREIEQAHLEPSILTGSSTDTNLDTIKEKKGGSPETKTEEPKSFKETFKTQLENLKSLFN